MERGSQYRVTSSRRQREGNNSAGLGLAFDIVCVISLAVCLTGVGVANLVLSAAAGVTALVGLAGGLTVLLLDHRQLAYLRRRDRFHAPRHALTPR
jgi:hypothetical protein